MPRRPPLTRQALCLLFACSLLLGWVSLGCGITSKRTSLENAVDEWDAVEAAEATPEEDVPPPSQPPSQNPELADETSGTQRDIALASAEAPIDEHQGSLAEDDPAAAGGSAADEPDTHAAETIEKVTTDSFDTAVLAADTPVLVDFYAEWCGPCKKLAPILQEFSADTPDVKVVKVDIEESKQLAKTYRVRSVPTLILFRQGKPVSEHRGIADRRSLETLLSR